jgi:hypothetical protein
LVVSVPGADENGASVFERVLDHANAELAAMVDEGAITADERRRMALKYGRGACPISSRRLPLTDAFSL